MEYWDGLGLGMAGSPAAKAQATVKTILLHRKGASIRGKIYVRSKVGQDDLQAGQNVEVELRMQGNFQKPFLAVRSSATGEYAFTNLPEYADYALTVHPMVRDGEEYRLLAQPEIPGNIPADGQFLVPPGVLEFGAKGSLLVVSPLDVKWKSGESVDIRFSGPIDTSGLKPEAIMVFHNDRSVAVRHTWEDDNAMLSIRIFQGDWPSLGTLVARLSGLKGVNGDPLNGEGPNGTAIIRISPDFSGSIPGRVDSIWVKSMIFSPSIGMVDTNVVDNATTNYSLLWNEVEGASSYEVYSRESPEDLWNLSGMASDTTFLFLAPMSQTFKPMTRQHMVIARNEERRGDLSDGGILSLRDGVGPIFGGGIISRVNGNNFGVSDFDNTFGSETKVVLLRVTLRDVEGNPSPGHLPVILTPAPIPGPPGEVQRNGRRG